MSGAQPRLSATPARRRRFPSRSDRWPPTRGYRSSASPPETRWQAGRTGVTRKRTPVTVFPSTTTADPQAADAMLNTLVKSSDEFGRAAWPPANRYHPNLWTLHQDRRAAAGLRAVPGRPGGDRWRGDPGTLHALGCVGSAGVPATLQPGPNSRCTGRALADLLLHIWGDDRGGVQPVGQRRQLRQPGNRTGGTPALRTWSQTTGPTATVGEHMDPGSTPRVFMFSSGQVDRCASRWPWAPKATVCAIEGSPRPVRERERVTLDRVHEEAAAPRADGRKQVTRRRRGSTASPG